MLDGRELEIEGCIPTRDAVIAIEIVKKELPDLVDKLNEFRLLNNVERAVERKKQEELQVVLEHEYAQLESKKEMMRQLQQIYISHNLIYPINSKMARKLKKTSKKVWRSFHPGIEICETLLDELDCENDEVLESPGPVEYQPFIIPKKPDRKPRGGFKTRHRLKSNKGTRLSFVN